MTWRANKRGPEFRPIFPSPTAGDGILRPNNARTGKNQPNAKPSPRRKVKCKICGFLADLSRHDNSGGSLEGSGALGNFTSHSSDSNVKEQAYRVGGGCPLCGSKNYGANRR